MNQAPQKDFINIEEVIQKKNPKLLKLLPRFVIRYIKKILHQDMVNDFIRRHGEKPTFEFADEIIKEFGAIVSYEGLENIPLEGGGIIAANHPLGGIDAIAFLQVIGKRRRDVKFIVNDVLLGIKNFEGHFVGVNKHGKNSVQTLDLIDSFYNSNQLVLIFPAGLVSRKQDTGLIRDLEWKKSFITKAKKFDKKIVPVHISGHNSSFFYNLARFRQKIGLNLNIEMFYLMDEMYHQNGKNIHLKIGKPIDPKTFADTLTDQTWAQKVKDHIYKIHEGSINEPFI